MKIISVLSVRRYKAGYEIRRELVSGESFGCPDFEMKIAYTPEGWYIGDSKTAYGLCKKRGIKPEKITPESNICSIGFCEKSQKWFGWSHRAIYGFGVGSTCERGDCHYLPATHREMKETCGHLVNGNKCRANISVRLEAVNESKPEGEQQVVPFSEEGCVACSLEKCVYELGKGEWVAQTLDDAKQMAIDFAEGVS